MKSRQFSYDPNIRYVRQNTPLPFDSSLVKRKFLNIPYATLSFSQKSDNILPDEGDGPFPVIAGINKGAFLGRDKGDMQVAPMPKGIIEKALHPDSTFESNENIDKRSIH
ncbi:MAG: hypothetical protein Q7U53_03435 [Anaerolineaceae bacterium]|nr:hypothetical protein [Anaerolineaceae bacterium]